MPTFEKADRIYEAGLNGMTKVGWDPATLQPVKLSGTQSGLCCSMACYWARESFQGDLVGKAIDWPESKIAIAQGHYVRLYGPGSDKDKPLQLELSEIMDDMVKIFDLKIEDTWKNKKMANVMNDLENARSETYLIGLNGQCKHMMAVRNREADFLFFCPYYGCMKRAIGDYRERITGFLKGAWKMTDDDKPTVYQVTVA